MRWLRVKENRISTENAFNRDYFGNGVYISSDNDTKTLIQVLLKILDVSSNLQTPKDVRRTFFNRIWVLAIFEPLPVVFGRWK